MKYLIIIYSSNEERNSDTRTWANRQFILKLKTRKGVLRRLWRIQPHGYAKVEHIDGDCPFSNGELINW